MKKKSLGTIQIYDTLLVPIITEKSTLITQNNQFVFQVPKDATKDQIKQAVEKNYKVQVVGVNSLIHKGKQKKYRNRIGYRSNRKKAIVTLAQGQSLDLSSEV